MLQKSLVKIKYDLEKEADSIESFTEPLNYNHRCPCCGSSNIVRNGKYCRNIVYLKENRITIRTITLQRFLCKKCHKTRTHYPSFAIPKREYSRFLITYILLSQEGIRQLNRKLSVSSNQIRKLRKDFNEYTIKFIHLEHQKELTSLSELHSFYEYTFLSKAFYPYQRDMTLTNSP